MAAGWLARLMRWADPSEGGDADNAQIDMANRRQQIEHGRGKERNEDLFLETVAMER